MYGESNLSSYQNSPSRDTEFQQLPRIIGPNVQEITQCVSAMQRMIDQIGTAQDNQPLQTQLHQFQHYIQQLETDRRRYAHKNKICVAIFCVVMLAIIIGIIVWIQKTDGPL